MREIVVTADGTGTTVPVPLNQYTAPFSVSYVNSGSGTVQVTASDPFPNSTTGAYIVPTFTWVTAPTTGPNAAGFLGQAFRAMRLSGATSGDTLTIMQAGI